ncbi:MAG: DUF2865 domain-containing protein [Beijerinckiaceae bacterium]
MTNRLRTAVLIAAALAGGAEANAQGQACQIAQAELAAFDRTSGGRVGGGSDQAEIARLSAQYYAIGCDRPSLPFFVVRPAQCDQIERRIARIQAYGGLIAGGAGRRERLVAAVERHCSGEPSLSARSRSIEDQFRGPSHIIIDEEPMVAPEDQFLAPPLGRAMCVRTCDGFYFPLTNSPNGREGADDMCQALCPAAETRAFYLDQGGGVDHAVNNQGQRYATLRNAYRFRREISTTCGCRKPGETWSKTLQGAEEMIQPAPGDVVVTDDKNKPLPNTPLRPGASPNSPTVAARGKTRQAIDPEPLEDETLEADIVPPEPSGLAVIRPKAPPAPTTVESPPPAPTSGQKKQVRVVGPAVNSDPGRPAPPAKPN